MLLVGAPGLYCRYVLDVLLISGVGCSFLVQRAGLLTDVVLGFRDCVPFDCVVAMFVVI